MSTTSVIMVSYHTGPVLMTAIASVITQRGLAELIIVDNGNPPDVIARLQQAALTDTRIKIITGQGNIGFASACNLGAKQASGEYVLLLNPDCILPPQALVTFMQEVSILPNTILAGAHMLNPDGSEQRGGRRSLLSPLTALGEILGLRMLNRRHTPMPDETHDVGAISGACMFMRKSDYETLGGLDEGYFLHVEDLDLCMRIARMGKRIVLVPKIRVAHLLSTSGQVSSRTVERHKANGFIRYFDKHFSDGAKVVLRPFLRMAIWLRYVLRTTKPALVPSRKMVASRKLMVLASSLTTAPHTNALTGKTVLVTGATSQVGVFVVKHLLASGAAVLAVSREDGLPFEHPYLKWLKADITSDNFSLGGYLADVAIHCAPQWLLPRTIGVLAASEVKRVIAIGSTTIYSKAGSNNSFEIDLVSKHKRAEQEIAATCASHLIACTILRPTMIYGLGIDKNVSAIARFIDRFGFFPVYPAALGRRQPVHAEDVALAVLQAAGNEATFGKSYNVSGGEVLSYREMVERIFRLLGRKPRIVETTMLPMFFAVAGMLTRRKYITRDMTYRMNEDLVFFHDDATVDFGYAPRPFLSGGSDDI